MRLVIISGRSGSGKTIALHALEDLGFYCIDNLPFFFIPELEQQLGADHQSVAVSLDARNIPLNVSYFNAVVDRLHTAKNSFEVVYLDANEDTLVHRFSETRRKHPLTNEHVSLREAIRKEQEILSPIANLADLTIDTSQLPRPALCRLIRERVAKDPSQTLLVLIQSFGFKYGVPSDTDFMFDVRCLANPYWQPNLRPLSGLDAPVMHYLEQQAQTQGLIADLHHFLCTWIPRFKADHRNYITISIGCTGGQHRSIYVAEKMADILQNEIPQLQIRHRDLNKKM